MNLHKLLNSYPNIYPNLPEGVALPPEGCVYVGDGYYERSVSGLYKDLIEPSDEIKRSGDSYVLDHTDNWTQAQAHGDNQLIKYCFRVGSDALNRFLTLKHRLPRLPETPEGYVYIITDNLCADDYGMIDVRGSQFLKTAADDGIGKVWVDGNSTQSRSGSYIYAFAVHTTSIEYVARELDIIQTAETPVEILPSQIPYGSGVDVNTVTQPDPEDLIKKLKHYSEIFENKIGAMAFYTVIDEEDGCGVVVNDPDSGISDLCINFEHCVGVGIVILDSTPTVCLLVNSRKLGRAKIRVECVDIFNEY